MTEQQDSIPMIEGWAFVLLPYTLETRDGDRTYYEWKGLNCFEEYESEELYSEEEAIENAVSTLSKVEVL